MVTEKHVAFKVDAVDSENSDNDSEPKTNQAKSEMQP